MSKVGKLKASLLKDSTVYDAPEDIPTLVPALNIALSGKLNSGVTPGITLIAGPSRTFKTNHTLAIVKGYLDKYADSICIFYDSEFGTRPAYFQQAGIDLDRVLHVPMLDLEEFKFDISQRLDELKPGDHVIFVADSVGNLASKKEREDALDDNSAQDMSRAKFLAGIFRIITPQLKIKKLPFVGVMRVYKDQAAPNPKYAGNVMSGGQGPLLAADTVLFTGRSQEKDGTELIGYKFSLTIEKSRDIIDKSRFEISATFEDGVYRWSNFLDWALEGQFLTKPKNGWYATVSEDGEVSDKLLRETQLDPFFESLLENKRFQDFVSKKYLLPSGTKMLTNSEDE